MKYMAIIDANERPVSCEFIGCNGNVAPYLIGTTTDIKAVCDKQRYVVPGINNDKMEFVDKYSVRAFNRYVEFIKHVERIKRKESFDKVKNEIIKESFPDNEESCFSRILYLGDVLRIIDKYAESENK